MSANNINGINDTSNMITIDIFIIVIVVIKYDGE